MSHVAKSKILEEIIIELRRKGLEIAPNAMSDLKSARTLIKLEKTESHSQGENEPRIDEYIRNVEAYVITEASKYFLSEQVEKWMTALDLASCDSCINIVESEEESRMIPSVPRDQKWIRVEPIENLPIEKLEKIASEMQLSFRRDDDGHLIVYGSQENIKEFVKKMTSQANVAVE